MAELEKELWALPYYHGWLSEELAAKLLKKDGDFLVCKSAASCALLLSVAHNNKTSHHIFENEKGRFRLDSTQQWQPLNDFIEGHFQSGDPIVQKDQNDKNEIILRRAIERQEWELVNPAIQFGIKHESGTNRVVWNGIYTLDNGQRKTVALKELAQQRQPEERARQHKLFANDVQMMSKLQHSNIIRFYAAQRC